MIHSLGAPIDLQANDRTGSNLYKSRSISAGQPLPNPPFTFPSIPSPPASPTADTFRSAGSQSNARRRSNPRARPQNLAIESLPAFEFNPSSGGNTPHSAPQRSPTKSIAVPPRVGGHRRGGSEFIGGDGKGDGSGLMSSSPTKRDGALPLPGSRMGPGNRRGHAHRRSGAISSHDLSTILRPSMASLDLNTPRSGSAPTTPSDPIMNSPFLPTFGRSTSQPTIPRLEPGQETPKDSDVFGSPPKADLPRPRVPRVGFSETLEFIPRPLSTISSETSSSLSTVRPGHSVTGSITSIVSDRTASPPSAKKNRVLGDSPSKSELERFTFRTFGNALDTISDVNASGFAGEVPEDFGSVAPFYSSVSPESLRSNSFASDAVGDECLTAPGPGDWAAQFGSNVAKSPIIGTSELDRHSDRARPRTSPEPKVTRRQRKVKSWTTSILSRRAKHRVSIDKPLRRQEPASVLGDSTSVEDPALDHDVLDGEAGSHVQNSGAAYNPPARIDFSTWKPREMSSPSTSDDSSPILDLDAALGPFNTPLTPSQEEMFVNNGFSSARRRMHSSGVTGGFTGPGMHYHRRAESAPEMPPISHHAFSLHHRSSNTTMADVFEEDEEDESPENGKQEMEHSTVDQASPEEAMHGPLMQSADTEKGQEAPSEPLNLPSMLETFEKVKAVGLGVDIPSEQSGTLAATRTPAVLQEPFSVEIVDATEEPRFSIATKSSNESTITPTLSTTMLVQQPASAPMDLALQASTRSFDTPETASSVISSPDFTNAYFDFPRLGTAHSSITDRTTWSSTRLGEHGQDLGYSVDDVPSLTSSASTMISAHPRRISNSASNRFSGDRPSSLSAEVAPQIWPSNARKRSSLASLSRLVGSSYSEKSKLSIESRATQDEIAAKEKKKGNRISRLMRKFKPKSKSEAMSGSQIG
ncbi:MAG: hypothetical protein MMC33_007931 [Icmadophila ericetorum]|nr:hypothetical protein [Icmadophila ericetorum]